MQIVVRAVLSLVVLIAAGVSNAYAQNKSGPPAWIQVGTGTGPAKVSVDKSSSLGATVTIEIPGIQTESVAIDGAQYTKLSIPGAVSAGLDVGKPEVPAVPVLLARPTGSAVTLSILSVQTETTHMARVFPMQPPLKLGEQAGPLVVDGSFYASDIEYPSVRLSSPRLATWRDLDVVNVQVYPVVLRPAQREVIVTSRITFRVNFSGGSYPRTVASWMPPLYQRLIQNYDELRLTTAAQEPPGTKCLVFCDTTYASNQSLDSLCKLMTKLGDSTEVVHVPDDVSAQDTAIKQKIMERYSGQSGALRWVFLIGECGQVPPKDLFGGYGYMVPWSDVWYSDLDPNGDVEVFDGYPEVGIARLSPEGGANGNIDLSNQIAKIMAYMMGTDAGGWLDTITLVANKGDSAHDPTPAVRIAATRDLDFWDFARDTLMGCWESSSNGDITEAVERGTGILIYLGNGLADGTGWDSWNTHDENWTIANVESLHNTRAPVVFNLACHCGYLSEGACLSEQWMRRCGPESAGAVASFGCSGIAYHPHADSQCSIAVMALGDAWTQLQGGGHEYVGPVFDLGGMQMLMDAYIAKTFPGTYGLSNIFSFMWLGNPAMQVWSGGIPESAVVSYPTQIPTGPQSFHVTVKTSSGQPFENAQVCAYKEDDFYVVGSTNGAGDVWLSLTANDTGEFSVSSSGGHVLLSSPGQDHTPMLPYFGTSDVDGDTAFSTAEMTYPNWGRKLVRDPVTGTLHVAYTDKDSVFYTHSTDAGVSWSTAEPIGAGAYPAMVLNEGATGLVPWVAYVTSGGSIMRAIRSGAAWDTATIFPGSATAIAGAPSLAAPVSVIGVANAGVTYPVSIWPNNNYVFYNVFTAGTVSQPEIVDSAGATSCYGASIAVTPGTAMHICWIRGQSVFYSQKGDPDWTPPYQISSPVYKFTEPASSPSLEAYGDSVFCVWRGPDSLGSFPGEIWRRSRWLAESVWVWRDPSNQSQSPDRESDYPVMTTSYATVWHEQVPRDNTAIWGRFLTDAGPHELYQAQLPSRYPQVDGYWPIPNTWLFRLRTVWTEQISSNPPDYEWNFGSHDYIPALGKGLGPGPHQDYEPAAYYAAELGQPDQSPYCLSRGGYAKFDSWDADTSGTVLSYRLPYLNPRMAYKLRGVMYHQGKDTWDITVRCDSGPWHRVRVAPNLPDTFWLQVPKTLYKNDARILVEVARLTGDYASLARLRLFQIEGETGDDGGVQSADYSGTFVTCLRGFSPNPVIKATSVNYELAQYGPVDLTAHDVSGRLVRRLASGLCPPGRHTVTWDGADGHGREVPSGVYFVRFSAGSLVSTGRLTLVR